MTSTKKPAALFAAIFTGTLLLSGSAFAQDAMKSEQAVKAGTEHGDSMKADSMKPDAMKPDAMKSDAMKSDKPHKAMQHGKTAKPMHDDSMKSDDGMRGETPRK